MSFWNQSHPPQDLTSGAQMSNWPCANANIPLRSMAKPGLGIWFYLDRQREFTSPSMSLHPVAVTWEYPGAHPGAWLS